MSKKRTCEACKRTMGEGDIRKVDPRTGKLSCTQCVNAPSVQPNKIDVTAAARGRRYRVREMYDSWVVWDTEKDVSVKAHPTRNAAQRQAKGLNEEHEDRMAHPDEYNGHTASVKADGSIVARSLDVEPTAWKRVTAHDGGDGKVVRHCFSCGSGGVVGRSDGTVECTICETVFTVQVQPRNTFAPQTVNGQPVHIPGMPEESEVTPSTQVPGTESSEEQAPGEEPGDEVVPTISDDDLSEFMTATGQRLDEERYAQYLALGVTPERDRTLAMVRKANLSTSG